MSITGIVENDTVKLPIHVPDGTKVEITLPETSAPAAGAWMLKYAGAAGDLPADAAAQHDHYLYCTPKR